ELDIAAERRTGPKGRHESNIRIIARHTRIAAGGGDIDQRRVGAGEEIGNAEVSVGVRGYGLGKQGGSGRTVTTCPNRIELDRRTYNRLLSPVHLSADPSNRGPGWSL